MTFSLPVLAIIFLALATGIALLLRAKPGFPRVSWQAAALAAVVLVLLTAVFDSLMISSGLFTYGEHLISGIRVGLAPIEDFAYPLTMVIMLPALWTVLTRPHTISVSQLLKHAFLVSRPISWINTAFPFAAALILTTRELDWVTVVGIIYYLVPYNLAMYGINDVFDYESDIKNPRKGGIEGALLPPPFHKPLLWLILATNLPFLIVLIAVGSVASTLTLAISTFAVIAYSAPKLRFKERPVLDSLTSSTHFVSPALVGLTLAGAHLTTTHVLILSAFFVWGVAAQAFGAVQDIAPDRSSGIGSIASSFGAAHTVRLALVLWFTAGILMLATPWPGPLAALIALPYLINCAPYIRISDAHAAVTNRAWRRFIWLNYLSGFLVTLIMILSWSISS